MTNETSTAGGGERRLAERDSYGIVLLLLVALYLLVGIDVGPGGSALKAALAFGTLWLALYTSHARRRALLAVGVLSVLVIAAGIIEAFVESDALRGAIAATVALIMLFTSVVITRRIFNHSRITVSTVLGAVCVYVLYGLMFAFAFQSVEVIQSDAFFTQRSADSPGSDFSYFSFVTLTTLGYGDLTPASDLGRSLAVLEAVLGTVYLVAVLGLIVGNLGRTRSADSRADEQASEKPLPRREK